jgi:hypothetical protein
MEGSADRSDSRTAAGVICSRSAPHDGGRRCPGFQADPGPANLLEQIRPLRSKVIVIAENKQRQHGRRCDQNSKQDEQNGLLREGAAFAFEHQKMAGEDPDSNRPPRRRRR